MRRVAGSMLVVALALGSASAADVRYFAAPQVTAAFGKGAVLFDGAGTNYMVHASRRDAAGQAEVHTRDTDVVYVLDGQATFVTGGTVENPANTAPDEIRGSGIRGGETRELAAGDVIIVPNGTPHWFKVIGSPMRYFVVKVR